MRFACGTNHVVGVSLVLANAGVKITLGLVDEPYYYSAMVELDRHLKMLSYQENNSTTSTFSL
jgi:hypothetical protein